VANTSLKTRAKDFRLSRAIFSSTTKCFLVAPSGSETAKRELCGKPLDCSFVQLDEQLSCRPKLLPIVGPRFSLDRSSCFGGTTKAAEQEFCDS